MKRHTDVSRKQCAAFVDRGYKDYPCSNNATLTMAGMDLCVQHERQAKRWDADGRLAKMARFWWHRNLETAD